MAIGASMIPMIWRGASMHAHRCTADLTKYVNIIPAIALTLPPFVIQSTVFRTFQGWLAMSETAPSQGTLKVFPDVLLANAYIIMRPFFRPVSDLQNSLDAKNWEYGKPNLIKFHQGSSNNDVFQTYRLRNSPVYMPAMVASPDRVPLQHCIHT